MKSGIDYFPLDVLLDEKFELIEAEFGLTGFAVVVKLFQRIYGQQGYYCEWTDEVALLFGRACGVGGGVVSEIVAASIRRGIFDKALYDQYRILTSKGIQERYCEAVSRRKSVALKREYLLFPAAQKYGNVHIAGENADISGGNADSSKQSRVEERRVDESRGKESRGEAGAASPTAGAAPPPPTYEGLAQEYGRPLADLYIAKARRYGKREDKLLLSAAQWLAEDRASGRLERLEKRQRQKTPDASRPPSFDLAEYERAVRDFVPVYTAEGKKHREES